LIKDKSLKSPEKDSIIVYLKKEVDEYDSSEIKADEEYENHVYKILKRLNSKYEELCKEEE
jgi:isocitrate dehydrogenase